MSEVCKPEQWGTELKLEFMHPHSAKLWWLGISIPAVMLVELFGVVAAAIFIVVVAARFAQHTMMMR